MNESNKATDRDWLLVTYGALKAIKSTAASEGTSDLLKALAEHLFPNTHNKVGKRENP